MSQEQFGFDDGGPDLERLADFHADFTPAPVVRQVLEYVRDHGVVWWPPRMLDPSAGAGVFGMVARQVFGDSMIDAVEPRDEELEHLRKWNDDVWPTSLGEALRGPLSGCRWDLVATNPPFRHWPYFVRRLFPRLSSDGVLLLLGHSSWGQAKATAEVFVEHPPWLQLRVVGRIGFRGPGINPKTGKPWQVDERDYSWWLWRAREFPNDTASWNVLNLPRLSGHDRRWVTRPGTEEPCG